MTELFFLIEDDLEGGYSARAIGEGIFAQGNDLAELKRNVRDAVACHFDDGKVSKIIFQHQQIVR